MYMRNQLLRDSDWAAMAHSIEVRVPLVDPALLRRLAPWIRSGAVTGKSVLAGVPRLPLPDRTRQRPKTGFTTPIDRWLGRALRTDTISSGTPWARVWAGRVMDASGSSAAGKA